MIQVYNRKEQVVGECLINRSKKGGLSLKVKEKGQPTRTLTFLFRNDYNSYQNFARSEAKLIAERIGGYVR